MLTQEFLSVVTFILTSPYEAGSMLTSIPKIQELRSQSYSSAKPGFKSTLPGSEGAVLGEGWKGGFVT